MGLGGRLLCICASLCSECYLYFAGLCVGGGRMLVLGCMLCIFGGGNCGGCVLHYVLNCDGGINGCIL